MTITRASTMVLLSGYNVLMFFLLIQKYNLYLMQIAINNLIRKNIFFLLYRSILASKEMNPD